MIGLGRMTQMMFRAVDRRIRSYSALDSWYSMARERVHAEVPAVDALILVTGLRGDDEW